MQAHYQPHGVLFSGTADRRFLFSCTIPEPHRLPSYERPTAVEQEEMRAAAQCQVMDHLNDSFKTLPLWKTDSIMVLDVDVPRNYILFYIDLKRS